MAEYQLKDSGVEWLGDIPEHWKVDRLKDVSRLRDKKTNAKSAEMDYLELEDIEQGTGRILSKRNTLNVASDVMRFFKGDVLFGKLRPYLAKYYLAGFDGKCTGEILAINPYRIDGAFLAYYVGSRHFINHCNNFSYGAKMPRINWNTQMGVFPVPIPLKTKEQKAIADYLDKACKQIDKTLEIKQQQLEKLESYRKSIIHEAVTKGLDESVTLKDSGVEWKETKLRYALTLKNGKFINNNELDVDGKYPVYGGNGVMARANKYNYEGSLIVIGRVGAKCGNVHLVNEKFWVSDNAISVQTMNHHRFMYYLLKNMNLNKLASETAQPLLVGNNVKKQKCNLPKTKEQKAIADYLDKACKRIDQTKILIEQQIKTLTNYRKSLIHECVTGKKRVYFD